MIKDELEDIQLKYVFTKIIGGGTPARENSCYWGSDIPWCTVKDFKNETMLKSTIESITHQGLSNSAANLIPENTLIIPTRMAVGRIAITKIEMAINQDLKACFTSKVYDSRYVLYNFIKNKLIIEKLGSGSTVSGIGLDELKRIKITKRKLKDQQIISSFLSQIDNLISTNNTKTNLLKNTYKAMINSLSTLDEEKILIKFSDLFVSLDGLKNVTKESFDTENTTSKYISFKNIHNQSFVLEDLSNVDIENVSKQNKVMYNDLLITMSSENMNEIGTTTINKLNYNNIYLNSFSKILRNQSIYDSDYLNYLLKTKELRKLIISEGQGITRINLSINRLLNLEFYIYLDINVQKRVSSILSQMDNYIKSVSFWFLENQNILNFFLLTLNFLKFIIKIAST